MISDLQIVDLAKRMGIPLVFCDFKDKLEEEKLEFNKAYIINMENELDKEGKQHAGSHWTCFQVKKCINGKKQGIYFDSFGAQAPQAVEDFCGTELPYSSKDIQSLMCLKRKQKK